jgi:hypothetical protein
MMELDRKDPFGIDKLLHPALSHPGCGRFEGFEDLR